MELAALCEYIDENLSNNFIRHSKSPTKTPFFFVKKKEDHCDIRGLLWTQQSY